MNCSCVILSRLKLDLIHSVVKPLPTSKPIHLIQMSTASLLDSIMNFLSSRRARRPLIYRTKTASSSRPTTTQTYRLLAVVSCRAVALFWQWLKWQANEELTPSAANQTDQCMTSFKNDYSWTDAALCSSGTVSILTWCSQGDLVSSRCLYWVVYTSWKMWKLWIVQWMTNTDQYQIIISHHWVISENSYDVKWRHRTPAAARSIGQTKLETKKISYYISWITRKLNVTSD